MYRAIRKAPYVIILIALVLTIALYPFMTKINSVVSSNESSLLPKNVESIKVMNIVDNSTNSTKETNVVYIISNVTVNSSSFYRLNSTLMKLNLSNSISWISLLNSAYSLTLNKTNYMLNSSLELANGIKSLWINVNNLSKKLYTLQNNIFLLSQLIRNADYIN
jgi:RND superfamily putative drug exporter